MHTLKDADIYQIQTQNQAKQDDWPKETRRNAPDKWFKLPRVRHSPVHSYSTIHMYTFPPNKHFTYFTTFRLSVGIQFCKADRSGLVTGHWPWWSSGSDSVLSLSWPDFKLWLETLLQDIAPKATQDHKQVSCSLSSIHLFILQILVKGLQCKVLTEEMNRDFPSGPVVKTPHFSYRGQGFDPWSGNWDPTCQVVWPKKKKKKRNKIK